MLSTEYQLAMKGIIKSMFAWTRSRLRKPEAKCKLTSKDRESFQVVMTPDRIPKFFIPSCDVKHVDFHQKSVKLPQDWCLNRRLSDVINSNLQQFNVNQNPLGKKKKNVKKRETLSKRDALCLTINVVDCKDVQEAMNLPDPVTQATLSLLHLPKVTTPALNACKSMLDRGGIIFRCWKIYFEDSSFVD